MTLRPAEPTRRGGPPDRVTMRLAAAELVESREILPGQWLQAYHAPDLASGSRAGQFVHVRTGDLSGLVLRRPFSLNTTDAATGIVTDPLPGRSGAGPTGSRGCARATEVDLLGPLGRPFEVDPRSQHVLLIAGGLGMAGVRMLADEAIRDGRQVTLLFGAASSREVYPSSLLPDEVEYVVATDDGSLGHHGFVTDLVPEYEAWADQAFACGPTADARRPRPARPRAVASGSASRRSVGSAAAGRPDPPGSPAARRKAFLQVSMEQNMGCAVGACLGCVVMATSGTPQRVCREGPVFAAEELDWEGALGMKAKRTGRDLGPAGRRRAASPTVRRRPPGRRAAAGRRARVDGDRTAGDRRRVDRAEPIAAPPSVDLSVDLGRGLVLPNPILVASGTFGYGIEYGDVVDVDRLGAICCKGTTLKARIGNPTPRVTETPGGMLNSIGLQNPGVDAVIDKYAATWAGWRGAGHRQRRRRVGRRLRRGRRAGSRACPASPASSSTSRCPNVGKGGLQFAIDAGAAGEVTAAVRRATDLPLLVKLSPNVADIRPDRPGHRRCRRGRADRDQHAVRDRRRADPPASRCSATSTAACAGRRSSRSRCGSSTRSARSSTSRSSPSAA